MQNGRKLNKEFLQKNDIENGYSFCLGISDLQKKTARTAVGNLVVEGLLVSCQTVFVNNSAKSVVTSDQIRYIFRAEFSSSLEYGVRIISIMTNDNV